MREREREAEGVGADASETGGAEAERRDAWRRIRSYAAIMPAHAFFIGPTAALIGGVPLPRGTHDRLHVAVPYPSTPPRREGISGRRLALAGRVVTVRGLRVADPAVTWASLGSLLEPYDLVAVADHLLRVPRAPGGFHVPARLDPIVTREQLRQVLDAHRWAGAARLRAALGRARTGASSRPETWARLTIVDAGLPERVLDHDIVDANGAFVACADMAYPDRRLAIEYDGGGHLERARFEHDIDRYARMAEAGWRAVRLTSRLVFREPAEGIRRIRAAYHA